MFYVIIAFENRGAELALRVVLYLILPMAAIWFSDALGAYTGWTNYGRITSPSPGVLVCILGWMLLAMPIVIAIVLRISGAKS